MSKLIVTISGLPGSGKSTLNLALGNYFKSCTQYKCKIVLENVHNFEKVFYENKIHRPFVEFNKNPHKYSCSLQWHIFWTVSEQIKKVMKSRNDFDIIILDRDLISCRIFSYYLHKQGFLSELDFALVDNAIQSAIASIPESNLHFLLDTPVPICEQRIINRNRPGECNYTNKSFLNGLRLVHLDYLRHAKIVVSADEILPVIINSLIHDINS